MQVLNTDLNKNIKISNIITTGDLKQKIDITLLNDYPWGIYDQISYNGICAYIKTPEMKGKVTVFSSGKIISIGSITIEDSINKLNQAKFYLFTNDLIQEIKLEPRIRNIVATISFNKSINLKKLITKLPNSIYEPDVFAGLRYNLREGLTALIFSSGKVVIAGGKSIEDLNQAYDKIKKSLNDQPFSV